MPNERANAAEAATATMSARSGIEETAHASGVYHFVCRDKDDNLKWEATTVNVVTTVGKNPALDAYLAGSAYTVTGPFMGLISSASFSAVSAADTMSSHAGWLEAGGANAPTYSGARKTAVWSAASGGSKSLSAGLVFTFTGSGTVQGAFMTYGTGAVSTIDNTAGTLYSASVVSPTRAVVSGDTLTVSYTASL